MNKKSTIQLIILGVLIIVLLVLIFQVNEKKDDTDSSVNLDIITIEQILNEDIQGESVARRLYARLQEETSNIQLRRNPFSKQRLASISGPVLNGIFWDPQRPKAIINDRIVGGGSRIKGYIVVDILEDKVILLDTEKNEEVQLELFE